MSGERDITKRLDAIERKLDKVLRILVGRYGEPPKRQGTVGEPMTDAEIDETANTPFLDEND